MSWFLKMFQHLTKSYSFPNVPHVLDIGKLDVCNNRGKKEKEKKVSSPGGCCPLFDSCVSSCIPLVLSAGGGFVAKAINRYKTSTESDQSTSLAG